MKRFVAMMALAVVTGLGAAPAFAAVLFQTATPGGPSSGSYSIGSDGSDLGNMIGAAFEVPAGGSLVTGVGATFDGNFNLVPGAGEQKIFVAIVSLSDVSALPSFAPSDIAAHTIASASFAPPTAAGDFTVSPNIALAQGAYAAIFGSGGLLGSDAAGQAGLLDGNNTIGTPNVFSSFFDPGSWSSYGFDTGMRIYVNAPEPEELALLSLGLMACGTLLGLRRR
jgi:hypothetical protein